MSSLEHEEQSHSIFHRKPLESTPATWFRLLLTFETDFSGSPTYLTHQLQNLQLIRCDNLGRWCNFSLTLGFISLNWAIAKRLKFQGPALFLSHLTFLNLSLLIHRMKMIVLPSQDFWKSNVIMLSSWFVVCYWVGAATIIKDLGRRSSFQTKIEVYKNFLLQIILNF